MKQNARKLILQTVLLVLFGTVCGTISSVRAQEKQSGPINRYVKQEANGDDYIVEFLFPTATWRLVAAGNKEKKVLSRSTVSNKKEGDRIRVTVVSGFRSRAYALYTGNIDEWANALTVYYTPPPRRP